MFTIYLLQIRSLHCGSTHEMLVCAQITMIASAGMQCLQHDIVHKAPISYFFVCVYATLSAMICVLAWCMLAAVTTVAPIGMKAVSFSK